jgi:hypothetical protein
VQIPTDPATAAVARVAAKAQLRDSFGLNNISSVGIHFMSPAWEAV